MTDHDITTVEGFLAVYDEQVVKCSREAGWCSQGHGYSHSGWSETGDLTGGGKRRYRVPNPEQREWLPGLIPDALLSKAGRALQAEAQGRVLAEMREGAKESLTYGLGSGYLTVAQALEAAEALGLVARVAPVAYTTTFQTENYLRVRHAERLGDKEQAALRSLVDSAILSAVRGAGYEFVSDDGFGQPSTRLFDVNEEEDQPQVTFA